MHADALGDASVAHDGVRVVSRYVTRAGVYNRGGAGMDVLWDQQFDTGELDTVRVVAERILCPSTIRGSSTTQGRPLPRCTRDARTPHTKTAQRTEACDLARVSHVDVTSGPPGRSVLSHIPMCTIDTIKPTENHFPTGT